MKKLTTVLALVGLLVVFSFQAAFAENITLRVWDTFHEGLGNEMVEGLYKAFEDANPGVTIVREAMRVDDMRPLAKMALSSGTGPDVIYYDTGAGFGGVLAEAGLLLPLDKYYDQFNWNERIYNWTISRTTYGENVYGVANEVEFYGVWYNKAIFKELGLEEPNNFDEFKAICETLKNRGYIPIAFGNQAGWPAYHIFSLFANNLASDRIDEILFGDGRWDEPEIVEAIRIPFQEMANAGYYIPGTNGVSFDDANMLLYTSRAVMHLTGSWMLPDILPDQNDVGFFFLPSINGSDVLPPVGVGSGYFISSKTQNPDMAAKLLDFLFSDDNIHKWVEAGMFPPVDIDLDELEVSPLIENAIANLNKVSSNATRMGHNIDVLTPQNFNEVMSTGFQAVIAGEKTPEQQAADLQAAWEQAKAEGKVIGQ